MSFVITRYIMILFELEEEPLKDAPSKAYLVLRTGYRDLRWPSMRYFDFVISSYGLKGMGFVGFALKLELVEYRVFHVLSFPLQM